MLNLLKIRSLFILLLSFGSLNIFSEDEKDCSYFINKSDWDGYKECKYGEPVAPDEVQNITNNFSEDEKDCSYFINKSDWDGYEECKLGESVDPDEPKKIQKSLSLICNFQKSNISNKSDVKDKYGRKIGSIEEKDTNKYALNIKISGDSASLDFDKKLLPKSFKNTNLTGTVRTTEDWYYISYEPNNFNKSLISINRYSGSAEIKSETFDGWGEIALAFTDAYQGKSSSKPTIIGSCEGGTEKKF